MTKLLHVCASPKGDESDSQALANAFVAGFRASNSDVIVDEFDLFDGSLPAFGREANEAKLAVFAGGEPTGAQVAPWQAARSVFDRFASADAYLFSVPMWNSGIPYVLKQWIDNVTQPGWVFSFDPERGYTGLITGKKAAVVYTSGVYAPGVSQKVGSDFQSTYFNDWLNFVGITDIVEIRWQPTVLTNNREAEKVAALQRSEDAGRQF